MATTTTAFESTDSKQSLLHRLSGASTQTNFRRPSPTLGQYFLHFHAVLENFKTLGNPVSAIDVSSSFV